MSIPTSEPTLTAREQANAEAARRMCEAEPVLVDLRPAGEVVPGMTPTTILTSGAPLGWEEYEGGQRRALVSAAIYEGLAADEADAVRRLDAGEIQISTCHEH